MAKGGMQSIQDPLAGYKNWAASTTQQNYGQNVQPNLPMLGDYFKQNFGQGVNQTFNNTDPLFQDIYKSLQGDIEGKGGPFSSLKQNLLGAFDQGAQKFTMDPLKEQMIKEGIYSSGPGMGVMANAGNDLATQRASISSQTDVNELSMAEQLSSLLMGYNQQQGFDNPLMALNSAYTMGQPQSVQDLNNMYYQKPNTGADLLGKLAPIALGAALAPMTGGASLLGGLGNFATGGSTMGYNPATAANTPGLTWIH